jgi:putative endopeptidase
VSLAYRAYLLSLKGQSAPVLDGFTGPQRFFMGWAAMWRSKVRDGYMRQWLLTLPHAPYEYRANGPVSHLPGFYEAFGVTAGDKLFRSPATRVRMW